MKPRDPIERFVADINLETDAERDRQVLVDVLRAHEDFKHRQAQERRPETWKTIMKRNRTRLAAAAIILVTVLLTITVTTWMARPTFAISRAIETLRDYGAVRLEGAVPGGTFEVWMRANRALTWSTSAVFRDSRGAIAWTKEGSTYYYEPSGNTVYVEKAITLGARPWLGPGLLEALSQAPGAELLYGKDPATGGDRATLLSAMTTAQGPQSFVIEFDVASKLPVSFKQWGNLERRGAPAFEAARITYYKDLPDSLFDVRIPGNPAIAEKPLTIPEGNVDILADPGSGMSAEGMTRQAACEGLLRAVYQAVIAGDLAQLRKLVPVSATLQDDTVRAMILKTGKSDRVVELLAVGRICATGQSKLGPVEAVPVVVRLQNGARLEEKMLVQFRLIQGRESCVLHGPYGFPREIE